MSNQKKPTAEHKIISISKLAQASKIDYMKIYNTLTGKYNGLNHNEKTAILNALYTELTPFVNFLGFELKFKKLPKEKVEEN